MSLMYSIRRLKINLPKALDIHEARELMVPSDDIWLMVANDLLDIVTAPAAHLRPEWVYQHDALVHFMVDI